MIATVGVSNTPINEIVYKTMILPTNPIPTRYHKSTFKTYFTEDLLYDYGIVNVRYQDNTLLQIAIADGQNNDLNDLHDNWESWINTSNLPIISRDKTSVSGQFPQIDMSFNAYAAAIYYLFFIKTMQFIKFTEQTNRIIMITNVDSDTINFNLDLNNAVFYIGRHVISSTDNYLSNLLSIGKMLSLYQMITNIDNPMTSLFSFDFLIYLTAMSDIIGIIFQNYVLIHYESVQLNYIWNDLGSETFDPYYINFDDLTTNNASFALSYNVMPWTNTNFVPSILNSIIDVFSLCPSQYKPNVEINKGVMLQFFNIYVHGTNGNYLSKQGNIYNLLFLGQSANIIASDTQYFTEQMMLNFVKYHQYSFANATFVGNVPITNVHVIVAKYNSNQSMIDSIQTLINNILACISDVVNFYNLYKKYLEQITQICNLVTIEPIVVNIDIKHDGNYTKNLPDYPKDTQSQLTYYPDAVLNPTIQKELILENIRAKIGLPTQSYVPINMYNFPISQNITAVVK